jgi:hypothetical protein
MNFSGTITEANGMTMTRLIERIVAMDRPGKILLHDDASGRKASIVINRGMIEDVEFDGKTGDPALSAIGQTRPWTFEFVTADGEKAESTSSIRPRPIMARARTVVKTAPMVAPQAFQEPSPTSPPKTAPVKVITTLVPVLADATEKRIALTQSQGPIPQPRRGGYETWIEEGTDHCVRFASIGESFLGEAIHVDDHDYFRDDFRFLFSMASRIGQSLGEGAPETIAIAEDDRATGYCPVDQGFLGAMSGAGGGVDLVNVFPTAAAV